MGRVADGGKLKNSMLKPQFILPLAIDLFAGGGGAQPRKEAL